VYGLPVGKKFPLVFGIGESTRNCPFLRNNGDEALRVESLFFRNGQIEIILST